jgi:endonuclease/exonuclease/phosphatase family metal-dependent hydrolase
MTFLYDSRKVSFGGLAGELVLPEVTVKENGKKKVVPAEQVWRTPFICGFKAGWSRFMLASVHITWGDSKAEPADRIAEIDRVASFLKKRTEDKTTWSQNLILLGDFNIFSTTDETFKRLTEHGFTVPDKLKDFTSNAGKNRHYDQIAFRVQKERLNQTGECGVFDYYEHVFTESDEALYVTDMGDRYKTTAKGKAKTKAQQHTYYRTNWRTQQMSDHLPMWVELKIDYSEEYLERKLKGSI